MLPVRRLLPALLVILVSGAAAPADVVILEDNDVPLTGTILRETETTLRFRIRGLPEGSYVEIRKERIKHYWRDGSDDLDAPARPPPEAVVLGAPTVATPVKPQPEQARRPEPRSPEEIRGSFLAKIRRRVERLVPDTAEAGSLVLFVALVFGTVVLWVGGRITDMESLGFLRCGLLSLLTALFVIVVLYTYPEISRSATLFAVIGAEILGWLLFVRLFAHEPFRKAVLLLSFLVLGTGLTAILGVSVLSVL